MEISNIRSLAELGMADQDFIHQWPMASLDELNTISMAANFGHENSLFSQNPVPEILHTNNNNNNNVRPLKQPRTNIWNSCTSDYTNSSFVMVKPKEEMMMTPTSTMSFQSDNNMVSLGSFPNQSYVLKHCQGAKRVPDDAKPIPAQDHVIAERKRRERLSQRFISLSALLPGLKKMDKASVLGDAIKYVKQLQERVKTLEEQTRKKSMESVVFVKKYEVYADGENSSTDENFSGSPASEPLPEIEARFSEKDVLIRVHCEQRKGVVDRIVAEIEKLHLSVINTCSFTFGSSALDITIIAKTNADFKTTMKDLVKKLLSSLKSSM